MPTDWSPEALSSILSGAGPYMGTAIMCFLVMGGITRWVENYSTRIWANRFFLALGGASLTVGLIKHILSEF